MFRSSEKNISHWSIARVNPYFFIYKFPYPKGKWHSAARIAHTFVFHLLYLTDDLMSNETSVAIRKAGAFFGPRRTCQASGFTHSRQNSLSAKLNCKSKQHSDGVNSEASVTERLIRVLVSRINDACVYNIQFSKAVIVNEQRSGVKLSSKVL